MDNFGSSEGACGGLPNLQGAGDDENAGGACGKSYAMVGSYIRK